MFFDLAAGFGAEAVFHEERVLAAVFVEAAEHADRLEFLLAENNWAVRLVSRTSRLIRVRRWLESLLINFATIWAPTLERRQPV